MKNVTIDANIWIAALIADESSHAICKKVLQHLKQKGYFLNTPTLAEVEVGATIARVYGENDCALDAGRYVRNFPRTTLHALDAELAQDATRIAAEYRLRGADSIYVATALKANSVLVTYDKELLTRVKEIKVLSPEDFLALLGYRG